MADYLRMSRAKASLWLPGGRGERKDVKKYCNGLKGLHSYRKSGGFSPGTKPVKSISHENSHTRVSRLCYCFL